MIFQNTLDFARRCDAEDPLGKFRERFIFPKHNGKNVIYFTGNSLGLQPVTARQHIEQELEDWANLGVEGHFHAKNPWYSYHELFAEPLAKLVGARPHEVVAMNSLTTNLHLLMVSFYRPTKNRYKILCEHKAFPSDQYALESQAIFHGFSPEDAVVEVAPRRGEFMIRHEDIIRMIEYLGEELALVMFSGVNYFTGQLFDMEAITEAGHRAGSKVGFDLAHAAGNVKLHLHDWNVDFAAWCSYKYLNSGPGGVAGAYIHETHCRNNNMPRFAGWWGHEKETRFRMGKKYVPMPTAEGWQLSNAPVFSMAAHKASLEIFEETTMGALVEKSRRLTSYIEFVIEDINKKSDAEKVNLEIITPRYYHQRGCQLSILVHGKGKELFNDLAQNNVVADWREPDSDENTGVIRVAPVPLYNSFEDVWRFGQVLGSGVLSYV